MRENRIESLIEIGKNIREEIDYYDSNDDLRGKYFSYYLELEDAYRFIKITLEVLMFAETCPHENRNEFH